MTAEVPAIERLYAPTVRIAEPAPKVTSVAPANVASGKANDIAKVNNCFFRSEEVPAIERLYAPTVRIAEPAPKVTSVAPANVASGKANDIAKVNNCFFMYKPFKAIKLIIKAYYLQEP